MLQQHGEREGTELGLAATAAWEKNSTFPQQFSNNLLTIALFCYVTYVGCVVAWRTAWHQPQGTALWLRPEWGTAPRRLLRSPAWATHPVQRRLQLAQTWWNLGVLTPLLNAIKGSSLCPVQGKALLHPTHPCAPPARSSPDAEQVGHEAATNCCVRCLPWSLPPAPQDFEAEIKQKKTRKEYDEHSKLH